MGVDHHQNKITHQNITADLAVLLLREEDHQSREYQRSAPALPARRRSSVHPVHPDGIIWLRGGVRDELDFIIGNG
jgi:hypothetical protein